MNTQHTFQTSGLMPNYNITSLRQRQKQTQTSRTIIMMLMMIMAMWGNCAWAFTDFEIDLMQETPVLPSDVTQISYPQNGASFKDSQHGWCWYAIQFDVDGPVRITLGGCSSAAENSAKVVCGTTEQDLNTRAVGCYHQGGVVVYDYKGAAGTMQVFCGQYCPYVKVEKMPKDQFVATWDWKTNTPSTVEGLNLSDNAQQVASSVTGVSLLAVSNGNNVKNNGDNLYMNNGGVLKIPAYSVGDKVHFYFHDYNSTWPSAHINGATEGLDGQNVDYEITKEDVNRGYISFSATATVYLYSITYTHRVFKDFALKLTGDDSFFNKQTGTEYVLIDASGTATHTSVAPNMYNAKFTLPSYHDNNYGYNNLIAEIPVTPGVYTIGIGNANQSHYLIKSADGTVDTDVTVGSGFYTAPSTNITESSPITVQKATVLTIKNDGSHGTYTPYFAISCQDLPDVMPTYTVTFYDADGTTELGSKQVTQGEKIGEITYNATVASGSHFRRWKDNKGIEVNENTIINKDLAVYACVTAEETASATMDYTYDFDQPYYDDEHEITTATVYAKHGSHGWDFKPTSSFAIQVAGPAKIYVGLCNNGSAKYTLSNGSSFSEEFSACGSADKEIKEIDYTGGAGTLTLTADNQAYLHSVRVVGYTPAEPEEVILYSWESPEGTVNETGGKAITVNGADERVNYANSIYHTICLNGSKASINASEPSAAASHIEIKLAKSLKTGDKITITGYRNKNAEGKIVSVYMEFKNGTKFEGAEGNTYWTNIYSDDKIADYDSDGSTPNSYTWTVPETEDGTNIIKLTRNDASTNLFITKIVVTGVDRDDDPTPPEYDTTVTTVEELRTALAAASGTSEYKIFVKNGTYDLGTDYNTAVKNYTTIIGESRDGVILKNQPTIEGLGSTATLKVGSNVTLKDFTLKCRAPYNSGASAERGVCIYDAGNATSVNNYENIVLDGLQDTYYSNGAKGMTSVFKNCIIRGTVDFICGSGNVTFDACELQLVMPHNGSKAIIAAPATYSEETGYVFNNCTVKASTSEIDCGVVTRSGSDHATGTVTDGNYYLARGWYAGNETTKGTDRTPKAAFTNSTLEIEPNSAKWSTSIGYTQAEERAVFTDGTEPKPFKDFTIDLTKKPVATLPDGVKQIFYPANGVGYNGSQHGWQFYAIEFDVEGPVDIMVGSCQYINEGYEAYLTDKTGNKIADIANKTDGCGEYIRYQYTGEAQTLRLYCGQYCPNIKVQKPTKDDFVASWDWTKKPAALNTTIQNTTGWLSADKEITMFVDASAGKLAVNGDNAQFNINTRLLVPVYGTEDKISVVGYPDLTAYSIHGTEYTGDVSDIKVSAADVAQGYIEITATANKYIKTVTLNHKKVDPSARTFKDFKIDFRNNPYTVIEPAGGLPSGVVVNGTWHDVQHGYNSTTITIPVDGPVKLTFGSCQHGSTNATIKDGGDNTLETLNCNNGCDSSTSFDKFVTWIYNSETPTTLTVTTPSYIPFFYAEACDLIPQVTVTYYNTDGTVIGKETVNGSSALAYKYNQSNVTVPTGHAFRGWFDKATGGKKVAEGITLNSDLNLYAVATPIETATLGSTFTYDLTVSPDFYFEDHELITNNGGTRNGQHGYQYNEGKSLSVQVAGNAKIILGGCIHADAGATIVATSSDGGTFTPSSINSKTASCDASMVFDYVGPATTVTLTSTGGTSYIHHVQVINEAAVVIKMASTKDKVTINNNVTGATVYYTLDGTTPTTSSESFTEASKELSITGNTWVKTLFVKDGMEDITTDYFCRVSFVGFAWKLGADPFLGTNDKVAVSTGVVIDDAGNKHLVPLGDPSSSIDITTTYHDPQHGYIGLDATVPVEGPVRIMIGDCKYANGSITITDGQGNTVATIDQVKDKDACYDASKHTGFKTVLYEGEATVLSFKGTGTVYVPFLSVVDASTPVVTFVNRYPKTIFGTVPAEVEVNEARKAYIPQNTTLYREGWTITGWTDDEKVYPLGEWAEFTKNTTLYPVMEKRENSITDANSILNVTWPFDLLDGAPEMCLHNKNEDANGMTYTKQVQVNGTPVDVPLIIDASNGKVDNTDTRVNALKDAGGNAAKGGQLNDGTVLTVPAVYGMTVTLNASNKVDTDSRYDNNQTHFGNEATDAVIELYNVKGGEKLDVTPTISDDGKSISFIYTGDATSLDLLIKKAGSSTSWGFFTDITVSYPVLPDVVTTNVITTAKLSEKELDKNAGQVVIKTKTSVGTHPNTGNRYKVGEVVTITATPEYGYDITGFRVKDGSDITPVTDGTNGVKSIDFTVVEGITNIEVLYARKTMYKVTVKTADKTLGTVDLDPKYDNFYSKNAETGDVECYYTEGTSVTALSEGASGYVIKSWNENTAEGTELGTNNAYTFTVATTERVIVASFKQGEIGSVVFDISVTTPNDKHVDGYDTPAANYNNSRSIQPTALSNVRSFTVPTNFTFFKNNGTDFGYTLKYWTDASGNRYELGKVYSFTTANEEITLKPVFELNPASQLNRLNNPIIHYEFGTGSKIYTDKTESFINPGVIVGDKKVAAQQVNIGNKQNFFWTSQVYTEVLDNGRQLPHTRDVAMWVATGEKGFFRNGDLDDWAAFGPGTTFWFASGAGTKVSIMTYAPITTTTIDGIVPTLDTTDERCDVKNHKYVYSLVVDNPTLRIPIVIGDDYSYYQWIETATLAANLVNLHADVDDEVRGTVAEIGTESVYGANELADGGYTFHQGDRVKLKFQRKFGFVFDKIVDPDKQDANGNPLAVLTLNDNGTVDMVNKDGQTITTGITLQDGIWGVFKEDDEDTPKDESAGNTVFTLKKEEAKTPYEETDEDRTIYEVEFNITTHRNLQICFKEKNTYYITYNAGQLAQGSAPAAEWVEEGDKYVIPHNNTLYYEGNTLDYWEDENGEKFTIGHEYYAPGSDLRLFPHFSPNAFSLLDASGTATWELATKNGAPTIAFERSKGILVTQLYNNDKSQWIDLKIDLDASDHLGADGKPEMKDGKVVAGKFNNTAYDDRCQINQYSVITFPSSTGCVISLNANGDVSSTTVAGKNKGDTEYYKSTNNSFSVKYDGTDANQKVEFNQSNIYAQKFSVKYTAASTSKPSLETLSVGGTALTTTQLTELKTNKTITVTVNPFENNEQIPAITGTATNSGVVKATSASVDMAEPQSTVTVWTQADNGFLMETYTIKFDYGTPTTAPKFVEYIVNGKESTTATSTFDDVPVSGVVKVVFDRTMQSVTFPSTSQNLTTATYSAERGKTLEFRYWNLPAGGTTTLAIPASTELFKDIYGVNLAEDLSLTLNVKKASDLYEHRTFDYIVGEDGDIDNAIAKANTATGTDRYYVFIPDGEYKLSGNENITSKYTSDGVAPADGTGENRDDLVNKTFNNGKTQITRANVSLIGQSLEGVTVYNEPIIEGISYTSTIHTAGGATDFYVEDMTLEDRFDYNTSIVNQKASAAGRGVVFQDEANRSIMKNVALKSWQDTYWSAGSDGDFRGYFESCKLYGVVDWLCGNGDIWFEKCDIVIRDRSGNNLAAPRTSAQQQWGYVLNDCNIIKEEGVTYTKLTGKDWTLARPWDTYNADNGTPHSSPACTFLNNKMEVQPRPSGWGVMGSDMVLRLHEYASTDLNGNALSLGTRSLAACSPAAGSDDCVLNKDQADHYTVHNALGGSDAFDPQSHTKQIDALSGGVSDVNTYEWNDQIETDDDRLQWHTEPMALCYFVFKKDEETGKWKYITNVAQSTEDETVTGLSIERYGDGFYCVRAANQRGGLGAPTKEVEFKVSEKYTLEIKKAATVDGVDYGWSTICLPYNSKVPTVNIDGITQAGFKVYAANGVNPDATSENDKFDTAKENKVTDYYLYLKSVTVINKNQGYVVYGPVGQYQFASSSHESNVVTILKGNSDKETIPTGNNNSYVLANKSTYGIGFYKYTGSTLAAYRAWLPVDMVDNKVQSATSGNNARAIEFIIVDDDEASDIINLHGNAEGFGRNGIYDLMGNKVIRPIPDHIYIIDGQKRLWK